MKADSPLFTSACEVEQAKTRLDAALASMEKGEPGNAIVYVHAAMEDLVRASRNLLHPMRVEFHRHASKQEKNDG